MAIPSNLSNRIAYHMTSIYNLESIILNGLLSTTQKKNLGISHTNIAEQNIQARRQNMIVCTISNRTVHDYVPFYFAQRTPMLLNILNKKNIDQQFIIYFAISISALEKIPGSFFSDSAANRICPPNFYSGATESCKLEYLNWPIIDSIKWVFEETEKQQKMAELLIQDNVHLCQIDHIITWNEYTEYLIRNIFKAKGVVKHPEIKIAYHDSSESYHYYLKPDTYCESIITGPFFLMAYVKKTLYSIKNYQRIRRPKFESLSNALEAIKNNFSEIKELGNIHGLFAQYGPHNGDVAEHCKEVANLVIKSDEYDDLCPLYRDVLEFAAFLHDIGKGPKNRWKNDTMFKADGDHPANSLQMLTRILTEDLPPLPDDVIRKIIILVTYDDLLGDIIVNGRDKKQLFKIIQKPEDIDLLVALSKADITSLIKKNEFDSCGFNPNEIKVVFNQIDELRNEVLNRITW